MTTSPFFTRGWFWFLVLVLPLALLVAVKAILLPFIIGMLAAYFLDPAAGRIERLGTSRTFATLLITVLFFFCLIMLVALLVPVLIEQLSNFAAALPTYVTYLEGRYGTQLRLLFMQATNSGADDMMRSAAQSLSASILSVIAKEAAAAVQSGFALVNLFTLFFVTPVVTFYLLRDWHILVAKVDSLLPRRHLAVIHTQFKAIDRVLSGFVRGQTNVCLFLALFYSIALTAAGLNYGLALGLGAGLLTFIPYVGALFGLLIGLLLAFMQFGDFAHVAIIGGVFLTGQFIEANIVAPRLVGNKVGLHPVWVIFGLLAGGALFGFGGVLLAVPVTAIIGVLIRYAIDCYLDSRFYSGKAK